MYCYHCGYEIDEQKIEAKSSTRQKYIDQAPLDADIQYVCPRCGHLIHEGHEEKDIKSLSAACHAELQRGRNDFARGMSNVSLAIIFGITGFIFLLLSRKADIQNRISVLCPEFWVFIACAAATVILVVLGIVLLVRGLKRNHKYTKLLKDINTKTFVQ